MKSETQDLRERIDGLVAQLGKEVPRQKLARALMAKACDVSLTEVGTMGAIAMTEHATSLLAGRWAPSMIETFIETHLGHH